MKVAKMDRAALRAQPQARRELSVIIPAYNEASRIRAARSLELRRREQGESDRAPAGGDQRDHEHPASLEDGDVFAVKVEMS